jgi:DNA-binding NtrC family response regulator
VVCERAVTVRPANPKAVEETVRDSRARTPVRTVLVRRGDVTRSGACLTIGSAEGNDLVIDDPGVSRFHVELEAAGDGVRVTDCGSTNGTRVGAVRLRAATVTVSPPVRMTLGTTELSLEDGDFEMRDGAPTIPGLIGQSGSMHTLLSQVRQLQKVDASVLILGESGTGKEVVARAIHADHSRARGPFVVVDCGALPPNLVASELFGHERGAFTGAERRHIGAFERAHGGTLFLDELAELSPTVQASLLGALERRTVRRVGGSVDVPVDVRVLAATNENLRQAVNERRFRLDLFHRIAIVVLKLPPLRERREDIPLLAAHFLREFGEPASVFTREDLKALTERPWPGNVRELRNAIEAHLALRPDDGDPRQGIAIDPEAPVGERTMPDAPTSPAKLTSSCDAALSYRDARRELVQGFERAYLEALLKRCGGNVRGAAREARMDRSYLIELMARHGLG